VENLVDSHVLVLMMLQKFTRVNNFQSGFKRLVVKLSFFGVFPSFVYLEALTSDINERFHLNLTFEVLEIDCIKDIFAASRIGSKSALMIERGSVDLVRQIELKRFDGIRFGSAVL
jgi:hypothetical protein